MATALCVYSTSSFPGPLHRNHVLGIRRLTVSTASILCVKKSPFQLMFQRVPQSVSAHFGATAGPSTRLLCVQESSGDYAGLLSPVPLLCGLTPYSGLRFGASCYERSLIGGVCAPFTLAAARSFRARKYFLLPSFVPLLPCCRFVPYWSRAARICQPLFPACQSLSSLSLDAALVPASWPAARLCQQSFP
ncbi:unnamed protein product [Pleuronectes platessa]|uniref:Uncharacterized protein n=1 Tax=Pleuronectes platessa TaxID=8262 RepID=A0A9N7Y0S9_PLEPL|nr:unnamed protein product [Pleuronectes platessa]